MKNILSLKKHFLINILFISMSFCIVNDIQAAQVNFDVKPSSFNIVSQPGKSIPFSIDLINKSDHAFFGINILTIEKNNNLLPYSIINSPIKLSLNQTNDGAIFIQKYEKKSIDFNLKVDPLAPKKDYYFMVEINQINKSSITNQRNIMIDASIHIPILLTVSEDGATQEIILVHNCGLLPENFLDNFFYQYFNIIDSNTNPIFECLIENKGLHRFSLDTTIEYSNKLGQKGKFVIPSSLLLSKSLYKLSKSSLTSITDIYTTPLRLDHWLVGKYQVLTILHNPISDKKWTSEVSFVAIPYKFGALVGFFIFLAIKFTKRQKK